MQFHRSNAVRHQDIAFHQPPGRPSQHGFAVNARACAGLHHGADVDDPAGVPDAQEIFAAVRASARRSLTTVPGIMAAPAVATAPLTAIGAVQGAHGHHARQQVDVVAL